MRQVVAGTPLSSQGSLVAARVADTPGFAPGSVLATFIPFTREINISPAFMDGEVNTKGPEGWRTDTGDADDLTSTLHHEYGHVIDYRMRIEMREDMFDEISAVLGGVKFERGEWDSFKNFMTANKAAIVNRVGIYAAEHDAEFVAELWAEYRLGKSPSALAQIVGRYLSGEVRP